MASKNMYLTHYRPTMPFKNRKKNISGDLLSAVLSKSAKYHPSVKLKFNNLGIFQSLKLRNLMRKILEISRKLNFTQNTLGCYELMSLIKREVPFLVREQSPRSLLLDSPQKTVRIESSPAEPALGWADRPGRQGTGGCRRRPADWQSNWHFSQLRAQTDPPGL